MFQADHLCPRTLSFSKTLMCAVSLCRVSDGELDLLKTKLDWQACGSLVLGYSRGAARTGPRHYQFTDYHLQPLRTNLHIGQVLGLSHKVITDALTETSLHQLVLANCSTNLTWCALECFRVIEKACDVASSTTDL